MSDNPYQIIDDLLKDRDELRSRLAEAEAKLKEIDTKAGGFISTDPRANNFAAEQCETELRAEVERLKTALKTVGDDYPGSSCQQWCYEAAGIRAPAEWPTREEADRVLDRLNSSDPDFDACAAAAALIYKLVSQVQGPPGFATWQDAAVDERMRRIALAARQSQSGGILRSIRGDIEAAYNGLDYLTSIRVATAADPNGGRNLARDAAEIKGRLLQHMKRIDAVLSTNSPEVTGNANE